MIFSCDQRAPTNDTWMDAVSIGVVLDRAGEPFSWDYPGNYKTILLLYFVQTILDIVSLAWILNLLALWP